MSTLAELPWTITAAWFVVFAWAGVQTLWFFQLRATPPPPPRIRRDPSNRRPVAASASATLPIGGTPEFLAELGLHDPHTPSPPDESVYR